MPGPGDPVNLVGVDDTRTAVRVRSTSGVAAVGTMSVAGTRTTAEPLDLFVLPHDCPPELPDTPIANPAATSRSGRGSAWLGEDAEPRHPSGVIWRRIDCCHPPSGTRERETWRPLRAGFIGASRGWSNDLRLD